MTKDFPLCILKENCFLLFPTLSPLTSPCKIDFRHSPLFPDSQNHGFLGLPPSSLVPFFPTSQPCLRGLFPPGVIFEFLWQLLVYAKNWFVQYFFLCCLQHLLKPCTHFLFLCSCAEICTLRLRACWGEERGLSVYPGSPYCTALPVEVGHGIAHPWVCSASLAPLCLSAPQSSQWSNNTVYSHSSSTPYPVHEQSLSSLLWINPESNLPSPPAPWSSHGHLCAWFSVTISSLGSLFPAYVPISQERSQSSLLCMCVCVF